MSARPAFMSAARAPSPERFPLRGVPGGWRDPWDADPREAMLATIRTRPLLRRQVRTARLHLELVAQARPDGRWDGQVASWDVVDPGSSTVRPTPAWSVVPWPSVNAPSATAALDALEAEVRELLQLGLEADGSSSRAER